MADRIAPPIQVQKKKGMGCFGCGCTVLVVIAVLVIVISVFGGRMIYSALLSYTSPMAVTLPSGDAGDAVYTSAHQKIEAFTEAFENQQPATLTLSADEINTLLTRDPAYDKMRGHFHIAMHDDVAEIQISTLIGDLETAALGQPSSFGDRYLNATITGNLSIDQGTHMPLLNLTAVKANGMDLPASYLPMIGGEISGVAYTGLQKNQIARDFLAKVQKADVESGNLVIEIK